MARKKNCGSRCPILQFSVQLAFYRKGKTLEEVCEGRSSETFELMTGSGRTVRKIPRPVHSRLPRLSKNDMQNRVDRQLCDFGVLHVGVQLCEDTQDVTIRLCSDMY